MQGVIIEFVDISLFLFSIITTFLATKYTLATRKCSILYPEGLYLCCSVDMRSGVSLFVTQVVKGWPSLGGKGLVVYGKS